MLRASCIRNPTCRAGTPGNSQIILITLSTFDIQESNEAYTPQVVHNHKCCVKISQDASPPPWICRIHFFASARNMVEG